MNAKNQQLCSYEPSTNKKKKNQYLNIKLNLYFYKYYL